MEGTVPQLNLFPCQISRLVRAISTSDQAKPCSSCRESDEQHTWFQWWVCCSAAGITKVGNSGIFSLHWCSTREVCIFGSRGVLWMFPTFPNPTNPPSALESCREVSRNKVGEALMLHIFFLLLRAIKKYKLWDKEKYFSWSFVWSFYKGCFYFFNSQNWTEWL